MSTDTPPARPNRRAVQTAQTRREILQAARRCFAASGYAGTSLKDVAAQAGVSVQTIYDSVGSKADLVGGLNDLVDEEAQIFELIVEVAGVTNPVEIASLPARITHRLMERSGDIIRVAMHGMHADPALAPAVMEGDRRHREGTEMVANRLSELGQLRAGLDVADAARTIASLADILMAIILIDQHGLDLDQVEAWMIDTIIRSVLSADPLTR